MLRKYIRRVQRSLFIEKSMPILQYGLFFSLLTSVVIFVLSRLFVWPYYQQTALILFAISMCLTIILIGVRRTKEHEAMLTLDSYFAHNELVTAQSLKNSSSPLVPILHERAIANVTQAYEAFQKRPKKFFYPKAILAFLVTACCLALLYMFPAKTQMAAIEVEKERAIIEEVKKEIAKLTKKAETKEIKEQLQTLQNDLKKTETAEQALGEVVKKQKELALQQQQLEKQQQAAKNGESSSELSKEQVEQLKELAQTTEQLTKNANATQTAMSKIGKQPNKALQNAIASANNASPSNSQSQNQGQNANSQNTNQNNSNQSNQNQSNNGQSNGQQQGHGQQQGQQQGQGQGQGKGQGQGQGQGQGKGQGQGQGKGAGQGGSKAGQGQGSRDLVTVPNRLGTAGDPTVDGGPLGNGENVSEQFGNGPVTKGTIRPYEEVVGTYKDQYVESSERLQLPKDLQTIVQSYFTAIE